MPDGDFSHHQLADWCVFTTAETAARGLDVIGWQVNENLSRCRMLEPAAGDGAFVTVTARRLVRSMRARGIALRFGILRDRVVAYEINPRLATVLTARVSRTLIEEGVAPAAASTVAAAWCRTGDFLADQGLTGFTHAAGNPPFMRGGGSTADICVAFVEKSFRALAPGGWLAMIAPLSMASATGAAGLRRMIEEQGTLEGVEVLRPKQAFRSRVSVVSGLYVVRKSARRRSSAQQGYSRWLAGPTDACKAFERLATTMPTLEEAGCRVKLGMTTGANSVFVGKTDDLPVERELLIPAVEIRDMPNGILAWRGRMVIVTHGLDGLPWPSGEWPALDQFETRQHWYRLDKKRRLMGGAECLFS